MNSLHNSFSDMDPEIIRMFFSYVVEQDSDCVSLRLIDSKCKRIVDDHLRSHWELLKIAAPEGHVDLPRLMERIEGENIQGQSILAVNPRCLFQKLANAFAKLGVELPVGKLLTTPADYAELQSRVDREALIVIWRTVNGQLRLPILLNTAEEILAWFENPDNADYLDSITDLNLCSLRLNYLPAVVAKFKQLQTLWLLDNQLTTLPKTIGNLSQLQRLNLNLNKLTALPPELGALSHLLELDISHNQLASLPSEIGGLSQLMVLSLDYNQLAALPEELDNLSQLRSLGLEQNRLIFIPDRVLNSNIEGIINNPEVVRFKSELAHLSISPLAQLYQSIMKNAGETEIKERFDSLSDEERALIYELVWTNADSPESNAAQWAKVHAFEDMTRFSLAVVQAISTQLYRISQTEQSRVYDRVHQFSRERDPSAGHWSVHRAFDNLPMLADAIFIERAASSQDGLIQMN